MNRIPIKNLFPITLFSLLCILYLGFSWSTVLGGFGGDNAHYLFMARHFSPYSASSTVTEYFASHSIFPPLFPLLLGLTGGGESLLAAHLVTTSFLLLAFGMFFWWSRSEGLGLFLTGVTLLILMFLPGIYLQTLSVHSENLYLLCSLAVLACTSVAHRAKSMQVWMMWAVIAITAAYLTRGAGLALVTAWLGWLWLNRIQKRLLFSLAVILPVILWSRFGNAGSTSYWQHLGYSYHNPTALLEQIGVQSHYLFTGWLMNFGSSHTAFIGGILILVLGLVAAVWRTWLRRIDGFYVWCYLAMVVLWPFPAEAQRMVLVILPILLWQTVWMLSRWRWEIRSIQPLNAVVLIILLLASLPELALNVQRFFSPLPSGVPEAYRHTDGWYSPDLFGAISDIQFSAALESDLLHLSEVVPAGECIFTIKPSIVAFLSNRISKAPPSASVDKIKFESDLKMQGCRYFYMFAFASPSYPVAMYPYQRMQSELEVIKPTLIQSTDGSDGVVGLLARLK